MNSDQSVRDELLFLLRGGHAHMPFEAAVADFPAAHFNTCPLNVSYTPWHLLEHLRITQADILEFIRNPKYVYLNWPDDYWPAVDAQADAAAWQATIAGFKADNQALQAIVADPAKDLYTPLAHGEGQNILREILVVADHNAYHIGELAILRQVMGTWPAGHK
jgi:hypothetical protein